MPATATAFAPASIGNVGVGFDMLGLALAGIGDRVTARRVRGDGVRIAEIRGRDGEIHATLSRDPQRNTASVAAHSLWESVGEKGGIELVIHKGVPLASGMGGSAASAVAGAFAANGLLDEPLERSRLMPFALAGEEIASGAPHADNVGPSLHGGLVLCPPALTPRAIVLETPDELSSVLLHPDLQVSTAESRKLLARSYSMEQWLAQQGYLAGFLAGLYRNDRELIRDCLKDVVIEPQRAALVPCFAAVKEAALAAGALGSSLSGSGPSIFALCENEGAGVIRREMEGACRDAGIECESWISPLSAPGARLEPVA